VCFPLQDQVFQDFADNRGEFEAVAGNTFALWAVLMGNVAFGIWSERTGMLLNRR